MPPFRDDHILVRLHLRMILGNSLLMSIDWLDNISWLANDACAARPTRVVYPSQDPHTEPHVSRYRRRDMDSDQDS